MNERRAASFIAAGLLMFSISLGAQPGEKFRSRLAPVPLTTSDFATIAGLGAASAELVGTRLTITGTFERLRSPATIAQIHEGPIKGTRGPVLFDLTVSKGTSGTLSGSFQLSPRQMDSLKNGRLYIQLHSEKAPEGNLWGWLTK